MKKVIMLFLVIILLLNPAIADVSYGLEDPFVPIDEIIINEEITLLIGEKIKINYEINPQNATESIMFTIQNSNVARIEDGHLIGISQGETILLAKADGREFLREIKVSVKGRGKPLSGRIIYVDPGHGGIDPGAVANGFREVDLNDQLSNRLAKHLREAGATVLFTRQPFQNVTVPLADRIELINSSKADILISVHHDGNVNKDVRGATTFYSSYRPAITTEFTRILFRGRFYKYVGEAPGGFLVEDNGKVVHVAFRDGAQSRTSNPVIEVKKSIDLANLIQNALVGTGLQNRGVRDSDLYMTRWANIPAILIEAGFVTNIHDVTQAAKPDIQEKRAKAITNAVIDYFQNYHSGGVPGRSTSTITTSVLPTGIAINKQALELNVGERETLVATITPNNATNKRVEWSSSNKNVVTVDSNGNVRAIGPGKATVTVKTAASGRISTVNVNVIAPVKGVNIKGYTKISLEDTQSLTAVIYPEYATNKRVVWSSSNPEIATIDSAGRVTGIKEGEAIITATTEDGGISTTHKIIVTREIEVDGLEVADKEIKVMLGDSTQPKVIFSPSNATNKTIIWESDNTSIVRVLENGSFRGISVGEAVLNGVSVDGGHKVSIRVTVLPIPREQLIKTTFRISNNSLSIDIPRTIYFRDDDILLHDDTINIVIPKKLIDDTLLQLNISDYKNMVINISKLEQNLPEHFKALSSIYQFSLIVDGVNLKNFSGEIKKQFSFDPALVKNIDKVSIYWFDEETKTWEKIDSIIDKSNYLVIGEINHWSKFILLEDTSVNKGFFNIMLGSGLIILMLITLILYFKGATFTKV